MKPTQIFDGIEFYETQKGYYLARNPNTGKPIWMHQYVWMYYNGNIPSGYHIHHKDRNRANNDISNLELIESHLHLKKHNSTIEHREKSRLLVKNYMQPAAIAWHKSKAGREWHKKHFEATMRQKFDEKVEFICAYCGKPYLSSVLMRNRSKFCSPNCKAAARRESGVDNITVKCRCCGKEFETNRYLPRQFCSEDCKNKSMVGRRKSALRFDSNGKLIARYRSASEASKELNVSASTIQRYCTGITKSPNGDIWKYESNGNDIV